MTSWYQCCLRVISLRYRHVITRAPATVKMLPLQLARHCSTCSVTDRKIFAAVYVEEKLQLQTPTYMYNAHYNTGHFWMQWLQLLSFCS